MGRRLAQPLIILVEEKFLEKRDKIRRGELVDSEERAADFVGSRPSVENHLPWSAAGSRRNSNELCRRFG